MFSTISAIHIVGAGDDVPSVEAARSHVIDRLLALQNVIVEFEQTDTLQPLAKEAGDWDNVVLQLRGGRASGRAILLRGSEKSTCSFRFLFGRAWYEQHVTEPRPGLPGYVKTMIVSFREDRLERLSQQEDNLPTTLKPLIGEIDPYPQDRISEPSAVIDVALGLRLPNTGANWLTPEDIRNYSFEMLEDARLVVTNRQFHTFEIEGESQTSIEDHQWVFDTRQDYALVRYRRIVNDDVDRELTMSSFDTIGGVPLPTEIRLRRLDNRSDPPVETQVIEISVTRYALNSLENTPESFAIDFPDNAVVLRDE